MSHFTDALLQAAASTTGMTTGEPNRPVRRSWAEIGEHAAVIRSALIRAGLSAGDAVAVLAGDPAEIAPAAQAIWLSGASVTMLHQPTARTDLARYAAETATALRVIGARMVVVGGPFDAVADQFTGSGVTCLTVGELSRSAGDRGRQAPLPAVGEDATALLQLTSGSTATPKAVRITHANLWANLESMCETADLTGEHDVMVSWLPLFHDMGMVGFLTLPMCRGIEVVKVTPTDFLRNPLLWPELISRHGGTCTAAPNFAYAITARAMQNADDVLDLSTLRFALNGAEPIDVAAAGVFLAAGERFGLPATAMVPAYGMAEATLGVAFHPWGTPMRVDVVQAGALEAEHRAVPAGESDADADVRRFPFLGPPLPGIEVQVRDDAGRVLGEREVGVLHLSGPAITAEYLTVDGPAPTKDEYGWLDTGDLGYLADGCVVVCGRRKDVIIMGGRNIYPTDIERVAQTVPGVRAGNAAAVRSVTGSGRESFGVLVESREAGDEQAAQRIADAVRSAVVREIGARPVAVRVLPVGALPKTPSGKIKRTAAGELLGRR